MSGEHDPAEQIRTLLLRGDNVLKQQGGDRQRAERALEAFREAEQLAADESVDPRVRELVARRIASTRDLLGE